MKTSDSIKQFLDLCEDIHKKYKHYYELVGDCDKATSNYLHALELDNLTYAERAKLTTQEVKNRKLRRDAKDYVEEFQPLKDYLDTHDGRKLYNMLREVLGKTRKIETYHETRKFKKREV